jgi:hypothetical protein
MPRSAKISGDPLLLQAALEGFELQKERIDEQISQLRAMLGKRKPQVAGTTDKAEPATNGTRRKLSAAARKRIAAAQKKRWAEFRKSASAAK